jgi:hypothetical protein
VTSACPRHSKTERAPRCITHSRFAWRRGNDSKGSGCSGRAGVGNPATGQEPTPTSRGLGARQSDAHPRGLFLRRAATPRPPGRGDATPAQPAFDLNPPASPPKDMRKGLVAVSGEVVRFCDDAQPPRAAPKGREGSAAPQGLGVASVGARRGPRPDETDNNPWRDARQPPVRHLKAPGMTGLLFRARERLIGAVRGSQPSFPGHYTET